jgi:hypothetical protein
VVAWDPGSCGLICDCTMGGGSVSLPAAAGVTVAETERRGSESVARGSGGRAASGGGKGGKGRRWKCVPGRGSEARHYSGQADRGEQEGLKGNSPARGATEEGRRR